MYRSILSVGGFTLLSRFTGALRDVIIAAVMGAGVFSDAFFVAQRLPNHFRTIFGEGAFNSAFVPSYSGALEERGKQAARRLAGEILTLLTLTLLALTVAAFVFMPEVVRALAPGFSDDPEKFALTVALTRVTFPYLLLITIVTLVSAVLNANNRFAAAAGAPILLNLSVVAALLVAYLFPNAAHAAAWGVTISGVLQLLLVVWDAGRAGIMPAFRRPVFDKDLKTFFRTLGPAVVGSAGVQIAMFADTIIASLLPTGAVSALNYADRLYQLPVGVIGIAAGTVLLPTMSKRLAAGDVHGAQSAQNRAVAFTLALSAPFLVAFLAIPDLVVRAVYMRGAFNDAAAREAAAALAAYGMGLPAVVLIRSATATFYARKDTATPLIASFSGLALNVLLKLALYKPLGAAGLALATGVGAWINVGLLTWLAARRDLLAPDTALRRTAVAVAVSALALTVVAVLGRAPSAAAVSALPSLRNEAQLALLGIVGAAVYGAALLALFKALRVPFRRA
ncbi:murein biosynthesis integral membrane protein MurJ [Alsobacter soli]|uniref:Probable lipid II flippase MurJ n=1 Tax=Alsobacter soli TaxID=2109933 RepID=A0A2T1HSR7_9HYPH|nr:murein biosynthesis integral membrane protein MurJ [Alsobacter soli]PSC04569.1 murein biosynthesis integral membrane protein MurJ [Alsobacter soli]